MAGDNFRSVRKGKDGSGDVEFMRESAEDAGAQCFEVFDVGFADFAQEQAFESRPALAIVDAHLGNEPVTFAAGPRPAVADGVWAVFAVARPSGRARGELTGLQDDTRFDEVPELVLRTASAGGFVKVSFDAHAV